MGGRTPVGQRRTRRLKLLTWRCQPRIQLLTSPKLPLLQRLHAQLPKHPEFPTWKSKVLSLSSEASAYGGSLQSFIWVSLSRRKSTLIAFGSSLMQPAYSNSRLRLGHLWAVCGLLYLAAFFNSVRGHVLQDGAVCSIKDYEIITRATHKWRLITLQFRLRTSMYYLSLLLLSRTYTCSFLS